MSTLGERFVEQARTYRGCPYYHAGRNRHGVDCIGLLAVVAHDLGITDHDDVNYQPDPDPEYLTETLMRFCRPLGYWTPFPGELLPGDLVQLQIAALARHVGIYAKDGWGNSTLIHCYQSVGQVVEHPFDIHWQRRIWAAYRLEGA